MGILCRMPTPKLGGRFYALLRGSVKAAFEGILRGFFVIFYKIMLKNGFEVSKCPKGRGEIWGNEQF